MAREKIWHYTTLGALQGIINEGKIRCDQIYIDGEIPCVWLSVNQNWEETVRKSIKSTEEGVGTSQLSRDDLFSEGFYPIRIQVDPRIIKLSSWKSHCKKIPKTIIQILEAAAKDWGANPNEWRVSYSPIPLTSFILPIEIWNGKEWIELGDNLRK